MTSLSVLVLALVSLSACDVQETAVNAKPIVDADGNGLIEINSLDKLDQIRNHLDGKRFDGSENGCPESGCKGFELTVDLDFDSNGDGQISDQDDYWNQGSGWHPIGTYEQPFRAIFDGQGHVIRNLHSKGNASLGLFGSADGAILRNIHLKSINISGDTTSVDVAALLSYANNTELENCSVQGSVSGGNNVGGVVGHADQGKISNCSANINVQAYEINVGGIVGLAKGTQLQELKASGSVHGGDFSVGGIVGSSLDHSELNKLSFKGRVTGKSWVGGIAGVLRQTDLKQSYANVIINAQEDSAGGLVGSIETKSAIENSYAACQVNGSERVGGLVGFARNAHLRNLFYVGTVNAQNKAGQLVGSMLGGNYDFVLTTGWPTTPQSAADSDYVGGLVGFDNAGVYVDTRKSAIELALESVESDLQALTEERRKPQAYLGVTLQQQEKIFSDKEQIFFTPQQLACPTGPGDTDCDPGRVIYRGWDTALWRFGDADELPTLRALPLPDCDGLEQQGTSD
jgi:hypothetical protein